MRFIEGKTQFITLKGVCLCASASVLKHKKINREKIPTMHRGGDVLFSIACIQQLFNVTTLCVKMLKRMWNGKDG